MHNLIPYQKTENNIIYTNLGNTISGLKLNGISTDLLYEDEIDQKTNILTNFLKLVDCKLTFIKANFNQETNYFLLFNQISETKEPLKIIETAKHYLNQYGFNPELISNSDLILLFNKIFNPLKEKAILINETDNFYQKITPDKIRFHSNNIKIDNNSYLSILSIAKYPLTVYNFWLKEIIDFPNSNFILQIDNVERFKSVKEIDSAVNNLKASTINKNLKSSVSIDVEQQIESFEELLEDVISGQELVKNITINIMLYAKTKQDLSDQRTKFTQNITSLGFQIDQNLFYQYQAFKSCLPLAKSKNQINNQIIPCRALAAGITCSYQKLIDDSGFYFGKINKDQGYLVFDLFKQNNQRTNSNMFIIGTSGSGKSFTTKKIINQLAKKETKIICLDPEREYKKLAENYQGNWIDIGQGSEQRINPLQIFENDNNDLTQHYQFLEEFINLICPEITDKQKAIVSNLIKKLYAEFNLYRKDLSKLKANDYPIFDDLIKYLDKEIANNKALKTDLEIIKIYFTRLEKDNIMGKLWNGHTTITMDKLFSVFDLYTLSASGNKRIINAQMFLILKFIENEVRQNKNRNQNKAEKQKILIVVDEAHLLIDKQMPVALNFMFQMVKRIRKYDGAIIVTTQNINDFIGDDEIKRQSTAIINNCQYSLIFQLKSGDLNDLNELLSGSAQLSEREEEALTVLDKGTCLFSLSNQNRFLLKIKGTDEEKELFKT